ncbi:Rha family transcriptional regulator [Acinetobacter baumannii]|uniref:Rha family transcriptional regulator n=1 Tax=Acinetobacter nosocomialis TaxID=106654 RepID=UPI0026F522EC|nr:Rha family transcriptional regulator [Acinetobacter nosocomialis]EHU1429692.1 Rha family transcriptional regulator [Acinetobacter baumannii]MDO7538364.1 Rha family transcriptional regulator [Acinetobacter nosocomialis]
MNALIQLDDAVFIQDQQVKTDSLKVAEVFGKPHKDVLQKIRTLDSSPDFNERNFSPVEYLDSKGESRPMYEMTKDGFIFLVMSFTGAAAAKIKEAYINTFNQMAAVLYNNDANHQQIHEGAVVQLKSGGPLYTISKIFYDQNGYMQNAEVMWHNNANLCREILPINCLTLESKNLIQNKTLEDFWASLHNFGVGKLNHSRNQNILALNLIQIYQCIEGLPPKNQLSAILMHSSNPFPIYMQHNHAVSSAITNKTVKCWIFNTKQQQIPLLG